MKLLFVSACLASSLLAAPLAYTGVFSGANESPQVNSNGTGIATVTIDTVAHTLAISATFSGLTGTTTAAHIHCCVNVVPPNAGVATQTPSFSGFPLGVTFGTYDQTFDTTLASTFSAALLAANGGTPAGAEAAFAAALAAGTAYFNIHTSAVASGEIRANLTAVPEPSTFGLAGAALLLLAKRFRRA
jgi:hypothetical protein